MLRFTMLKFEFDMDVMVMWGIVIVALIALALMLWDVPYFIRTIIIIVWGKLFEDKLSPEETSCIYGICTTNDLDIMLRHMNNARYVRELDFARFHFYERTGIYNAIMAANGNALQSACIIKYRRSIPFLTSYKITTKLIHWDEKAIYLEQQFITLRDGFVRAVALSKQGIIGINVTEVMAKLLQKDTSYRPDAPAELDHFLACMDASSARLRKKEE